MIESESPFEEFSPGVGEPSIPAGKNEHRERSPDHRAGTHQSEVGYRTVPGSVEFLGTQDRFGDHHRLPDAPPIGHRGSRLPLRWN